MKEKKIKILAIESSCDETAAALIELSAVSDQLSVISPQLSDRKKLKAVKILSNAISSQVKLHAKYGGVYPELASREHVKNILPVIEEALTPYRLLLTTEFDAIAITTGPGLIGSLLPGVNTAKTLSYIFEKPIYAINHVEGHIYANFISVNSKLKTQNSKQVLKFKIKNLKSGNSSIEFPLIALVVSGGHTSLVYMKSHLNYKVIGETLDDAAGEAFDKVAAMLGLGYPGGPIISAYAEKAISYQPSAISNSESQAESCGLKAESSIHFPRPMIDSGDFDFSFSGLKTSVLYAIKKLPKPLSKEVKSYICKEFQDAVIDVLVAKTIAAAKKYKVKSILLCGGVSANSCLRQELSCQLSAVSPKLRFFVPEKSLCTDNAAMIGIAAAYKMALGKRHNNWYDVNADSNLKL